MAEKTAHNRFRLRPIPAPFHRVTAPGNGHHPLRLGNGKTSDPASHNASETGVIVFSASHEILVQTPAARVILNRYLPAVCAHFRVPQVLKDLLTNLNDSASREITVDGDPCRLVIELVAQPPVSVLILTEQRKPMGAEGLRTLDLTSRESEVMSLVVQGKTNWEIGRILELSRRTVDKHMEHILQKLGAENRTTAMRIAMERCGY